MMPIVFSSSENTHAPLRILPGNTALKRKNLSGNAVIAEATKSTGIIMATQMKEISNASLEVERSKVQMQFKHFDEQMAYQRERDFRLHETVLVAQENARLFVLKQHKMVMCLRQLTTVLGAGLSSKRTT